MTTAFSQTSWFFKWCTCALASVALLNLLLFPLEFLPLSFFEQYGAYFQQVTSGIVGVSVLGSLIASWGWHRRESATRVNSPRLHAWLQGIIRYWLALSLASYGFAKILKTQFQTPEYLLDVPLGSVDGMSLTWYYFGYSYLLAVIIALFQIGGAVLLLYRRTTLLGAVILLPVMVNIVLINVFFQISPGAFFNSVVYSLALVFLILLHRERLKTVFWNRIDRLPGMIIRPGWLKHSLPLLPILAAFVSLKVLIATHPDDQLLKGAWKVEKLIRNGQAQSPTDWLTDREAWSRVYFAGAQGCAFSPNPYRFEAGESRLGHYEYDRGRNQLLVVFHSRDTLRARISHRTPDFIALQGVLNGENLQMQLTRLPR
ncbi:hypothetical protein ACFQ4C_07520 [Larkinella insperata]|uniref:Uncharacterized protein n=1 Tax=Larkinella insperata TaxID=332158 RepID=A0ABW3Q6V2_9BACT